MDMATAYATIANGGRLVSPTGIKRVVQNEGEESEEVLREEGDRSKGEQVIDPEVARVVTEVMIGDVTRGIATKANLADRPVAGKSGTSENFFDSWFVGFTPNLVTGVWMGYAEGGTTLEGLLALDSRTQQGPIAPPTVIFQAHMQRVLEGEPVEEFEGIEWPQTDPRHASGSRDDSPSPENTVTANDPPAAVQQGPTSGAFPGASGAADPAQITPPGQFPAAPSEVPAAGPPSGAAAAQYGF